MLYIRGALEVWRQSRAAARKDGGMTRCNILLFGVLVIVADHLTSCCLITNCPRGGKRNGKQNALEVAVKPCVSCGPRRTGQCFGSNICCGPFGCLMGTPETLKCQKEGFFHESEPCTAGNSSCRRNTGRCAAEGICCTQESCHADKSCTYEDKFHALDTPPLDFYNLLYPIEYNIE